MEPQNQLLNFMVHRGQSLKFNKNLLLWSKSFHPNSDIFFPIKSGLCFIHFYKKMTLTVNFT